SFYCILFRFCRAQAEFGKTVHATLNGGFLERCTDDNAIPAGESLATTKRGFSAGRGRAVAGLGSDSQSGKFARLGVPGRRRRLPGLERRAAFQSMGAIDRGAAKWRPINAGEFRRTSLLVRESQTCRDLPATGDRSVVQLRRRQAAAFARGE